MMLCLRTDEFGLFCFRSSRPETFVSSESEPAQVRYRKKEVANCWYNFKTISDSFSRLKIHFYIEISIQYWYWFNEVCAYIRLYAFFQFELSIVRNISPFHISNSPMENTYFMTNSQLTPYIGEVWN